MKLEHIGIAVSDLATSVPLFEKLLNSQCYKTESVLSEKVNTAFFRTGDCKVELIEDQGGDGVIASFIAKKGAGIHHIAFEVDNIREEMARLLAEGFILFHPEPKRGADNKWICFLHPKETNSVLIELCMEARLNDSFAE